MVPPLRPSVPSLAIEAASNNQTYVPPKPDPVDQLKDQLKDLLKDQQQDPIAQDPIAQDEPFGGPAFIVMSPTATMTQTDHPVFSFPLQLASKLRPQDNASNSSNNSTTIHYVSTTATSTTHFMSFSSSEPIEEPAAGGRSSDKSHGDDKSHPEAHGHLPRAKNGSEQGHGKLVADSQDRGRGLSVKAEAPAGWNGSRRGSSQHSRPIQVKETLNASMTQTADGDMQLGQYVLKKILGQGAYGIVNLGYNNSDKTFYVRGRIFLIHCVVCYPIHCALTPNAAGSPRSLINPLSTLN